MAERDKHNESMDDSGPDTSTDTDLLPEQYKPTCLDLDLTAQVLHIGWADGTASDLPLLQVRKACPCAACRSQQAERTHSLLPVLQTAPATSIQATGARIVGNYALQIEWSDGHNTGIYDYRTLRGLGAK